MEWYFALGVATGMRSMTAIAVLCWFAWLGRIPESGWASWTGHLVTVIVFTVFALGEYVVDTLPQTPSRKSPFPAAARLVFGGLVGSLVAHAAAEPLAGGLLAGALGAIVGTWGGYWLRRTCAFWVKRDLPVALVESALALLLALTAAVTLADGIAIDLKRGIF